MVGIPEYEFSVPAAGNQVFPALVARNAQYGAGMAYELLNQPAVVRIPDADAVIGGNGVYPAAGVEAAAQHAQRSGFAFAECDAALCIECSESSAQQGQQTAVACGNEVFGLLGAAVVKPLLLGL